jgi:seryl-tRNA synthetase
MLDINLIREDPLSVASALAKRGFIIDFSDLLALDVERRALIQAGEKLKARRNQVSGDIPRLKKQGEDVEGLIAEMKAAGEQIRESDEALSVLEDKIKAIMDAIPNMPAADVPAGDKENNEVVGIYREKPVFTFDIKDHMELAADLGLIDYERGVKLGGSGFWMYRGDGALLEWALINFFVEEHIRDGYEFVLPPHILTYQSGYTAGQFPKFEEDVFVLERREGRGFSQFLLPTAETALINMHRDEILLEEELPKKYFSFTPCYRSEAGGARTEERGLIRGHQFNKVEMFQYTAPENSAGALGELVEKAEKLMKALGLHYRVSKLAAGDCGASMAKTYDIEVWLPSLGIYKEVSSASNAMDYQARRGNMRFRRSDSKRSEYLHTLNASGLATSRVFTAILEQFQCGDGSVIVPEVLRKWVGKELIK